jgi:hypothetical protein
MSGVAETKIDSEAVRRATFLLALLFFASFASLSELAVKGFSGATPDGFQSPDRPITKSLT